jgi:membrane protein
MLKKIFIQIIIIILIYGLYGKLGVKLEIPSYNYGFNYAIIAYTVLCLFFCLINKSLIGNRTPKGLYFFAVIGALTAFISINNQGDILKSLCCVVVPLISFQLGSICAALNSGHINDKYIPSLYWGIAIMLIVCMSQMLKSPDFLMLHRDFTFIIIFFLPFLFISENKFIAFILAICLVALVFISVKRSLIIAVTLFSISYYGIGIYFNKNISNKRKIIFTISILAILIIVTSYYSNSVYGEQLDQRLSKLEEDGGSGRDAIYAQAYDKIIQSDIIELLFGHGYNTVQKDMGIPSHNELLEIGYDFGILSLLAWISVLLSLINRGILLIRKKKYYAAALFLSSFIFWQLIAETNNTIVSPEYSALVFLFFGLIDRASYYGKRIPKGVYYNRTV